MTRACRVALGSILVLGAVRMVCFLVYAWCFLPAEFESFNLEAKMVLLADRVRAGESLYPAWRNYPHVANFFGPIFFVLVGLLGRAFGTDFHGLFLIGRAVTFGSALATSFVLVEYLRRRYGPGAAVVGAVLSLGAAPMYGFSVMARPDHLAEFFGILGFFVSGARSRKGFVAGGLLLAAAILTKQTALAFLLAAASALFLEGRRRRALVLVAATIAVVVTAVAVTTLWLEPRMARDLFGESHTPWNYVTWLRTLVRMGLWAPDCFVFAGIGIVLWTAGKPRDVRFAGACVLDHCRQPGDFREARRRLELLHELPRHRGAGRRHALARGGDRDDIARKACFDADGGRGGDGALADRAHLARAR